MTPPSSAVRKLIGAREGSSRSVVSSARLRFKMFNVTNAPSLVVVDSRRGCKRGVDLFQWLLLCYTFSPDSNTSTNGLNAS